MLFPVRFRLVAAIAVTAFACLAARGQSAAPDDKVTTLGELGISLPGLPPDTNVRIKHTVTDERAKGEGASLDATGDGINNKLDSSAPKSTVGKGVGAEGGNLQSETSVEKLAFNWLPILTWLAAAVAGAFAFLAFQRGQPKQALSLGVVAGGLAAVAFFPALLPIGLGAGVLWLVVQSGALSKVVATAQKNTISAFMEASHNGDLANQNSEALRAVAAGVSDLKDVDPVAYAKVTELISRHADENDKATIKTVRRADDLH